MSDEPKRTWSAIKGERKPEQAAPPSPAAGEEAFSTRNAAPRQEQVSLDLRFKDGSCLGLSYAYLTARRFDPSGGITLEMAGYKVVIQGIHLDDLYRRLLLNAVASIQEVDEFEDGAGDSNPKATAVFVIRAEQV